MRVARRSWLWILLAGGLSFTGAAEQVPCLESLSVQACAPCHKEDAAARLDKDRFQPCAPFCLTCHPPKDMEKHHPIGRKLDRPLRTPLRLDRKGQTTCATCHHLGRPRHDAVSWKSESLYDRYFRRQDRHKTYLLAVRNDRGQLCKACH